MNINYKQDFSDHPISLLYDSLRSLYYDVFENYDDEDDSFKIYNMDDIEALILLNNGCQDLSHCQVEEVYIQDKYAIKILDYRPKGNRALEAYDYTETSGYKNLYLFYSYFEENTLTRRPDPNDTSPEAIIKRNYGNQMVFEKLKKITEIFLVSLYGSHIFTEPFSKTSAGMTFSKLTTIIPAKVLNRVLPIEPCDITSRNIPFDTLKKVIEYPIMFNILGIDYYE